jgi:REP element-mobilizing transposase RayT
MGGSMGQVFYKLFYHVIWGTKYKGRTITPEVELVLFPFLRNKAKRFRSYIYAINGTEDHIHAAISLPPSVALSDIVGKLKGSSSYFLNMELQVTHGFSWQDGFGALSFNEKDLPRIMKYIENQKEHHRTGNLDNLFERTIPDEETPSVG